MSAVERFALFAGAISAALTLAVVAGLGGYAAGRPPGLIQSP
jgi:hypothetical protein